MGNTEDNHCCGPLKTVGMGGRQSTGEWKGVCYSPAGEVTSCVFCEIVSRNDCEDDPMTRELQTDGVVSWFRSRAHDAADHWLVVPNEHVQNINDPKLTKALLKHMMSVADTLGDEKQRQCFHVPPTNSIDHLHLHAFRGPFKNCLVEIKHKPQACKWWTVSPASVLSNL